MAELGGALQPGAEESLDILSLGRRVLQRRKGHRSATDDLVAAWVGARALPRARRVLDLGCGHGTVTLHLSEVLADAVFVSVEVNPLSADLARRNMQLNGIAHRVTVLEEDLRSLADSAAFAVHPRFDLITGTPPFMPLGSGALSRDPQRRAARFELHGGVEDYCLAASRFLAADGRVSLVMDAAQDARVRHAFEAAGLFIEKAVVVTPRQGKRPRFCAYLGRPAEADAECKQSTEEQLVIRTAAGGYSEQMLELRSFLGLPPSGDSP
jgi:tRNA1(Val) A37 N6-methylase TrmN6